jgi:hypothetical protein
MLANLEDLSSMGIAQAANPFKEGKVLWCPRKKEVHRDSATGCVLAGRKRLHRSILEDVYKFIPGVEAHL